MPSSGVGAAWRTGPVGVHRQRSRTAHRKAEPCVHSMLKKAKSRRPTMFVWARLLRLRSGPPSPDHAYGRDEKFYYFLNHDTSCNIPILRNKKTMAMNKSPVIKSFVLNGLHGYKNLSIECDGDASIYIAENGVGKTTLLNALYAILTKRFNNLSQINFKNAKIKFINGVELIIEKEKLFSDTNKTRKILLSDPVFQDLRTYCRPDSLISLISKYMFSGETKIKTDPIYKQIYRDSPYQHTKLCDLLDTLSAKLDSHYYIKDISRTISEALGDISVLYLPTYRRIEAAFDEMPFLQKKRGNSFDYDDHGFDLTEEYDENDSDQLINFGLSDVESKLKKMSETVQ